MFVVKTTTLPDPQIRHH